MQDQALQLMQDLGFSSYEAKAYMGILKGQPVGAYELAKRSSIPTSKIYETLNKLLNKEVVQFAGSAEADNPTYVSLSPQDLTQRMNQEVSAKTGDLLPMLEGITDDKAPELIWPITSLENLKAKSVELVQSAQKSILLSCWADELAWLKTYLEQVDQKGVKIALVHFGIPNCNIGATYHHPAERTLYAEKGGRGLTIVVDSREVVIANISDSGRFEAVCSRNQAFTTVAEDYVKHDVYITKVTKHLGPEVRGRYGEHFEKLRNIFEAEV
jgi:sugar-specific transcriptional regulator TrmB